MVGVLLPVLLLLMPLSASATTHLCGADGNYTANSLYQPNLATLADTLPNITASSPQLFGTGTATAGPTPDPSNGLALCRGDSANATACQDCVAAALKHALQTCPNHKGATVYYDYDPSQQPGCILSFSSDDGVVGSASSSLTGNGTLFQSWNENIIPGDPGVFAAAVQDLLKGTARYAAADNERRFATAFMDSIGGTVPTLYSLAQCTPNLSTGDCLACLKRIVDMVNATTSVRLGGRIFVVSCNIRFEASLFYDGKSMQRIPSPSSSIAPAPALAPATRKRHGIQPWVIAISVAAPVALVAFCFIVYCRRLGTRYRKGKVRLREKPSTHKLQGGELAWEMEGEFSVFDFHQISEATNNFSEENKLGEGGFGPVYKGYLPDGTEIAIKRLDSQSGQGFIEFKNEVELIAKLQHRNLVKLMGCCSEEKEKILVYEYLPNKSLDFFIFDENGKSLLDWNNRISIIEGIAEGLLYLHKHSRLRVIHRDLKPSNILLDNEMSPKISDFGLAKISSSNNTDVKTTRVVGTYGYMAPEYASHGMFSIKSDVFSYGVLTLEILSGKRNSGSHEHGDFINLLGYAWQLFDEGRWIELVDVSLLPKCHSEEMMRCINIALLCVQENADDRPTMLDVVAMLSNKTLILCDPNHPAYFNLRACNEDATTSSKSCSVNDVTISEVNAR